MNPALLSLDHTRPLAEQIYSGLAVAIGSGALPAGERLPPSRQLARDLGVSRNTVVNAYQQLQAEGYLETAGAAGTRVSPDLPRAGAAASRRERTRGRSRPPRVSGEGRRHVRHPTIFAPLTTAKRANLDVDFDYNVNVSDPAGRRAWARALRRTASRFEMQVGDFDFTRRPGPLHEGLVRHLRLTRGVRATPERILLLPSVQSALAIAVRTLADPGDAIALEDPHYVGIRTTARIQGLRILPIPVDDQGLCVDRLPGRTSRARILYTTPSHQWPSGVVQPVARRLTALEWARGRDAWILENDHNCEYRYEGTPVPSIQGLDDSGRTLYFGAFNRMFSPPPAMGFLVVPDALVDTFRAASLEAGATISRIEQEAMAEFLRSGEIERLLRRVWRRTRERRRLVLTALAEASPQGTEVRAGASGLHIHLRFPGRTVEDVERIAEEARRRGVGVYPDAPFHLVPARAPGLLVGFARPPRERLVEGILRLAEAIAAVPAGSPGQPRSLPR